MAPNPITYQEIEAFNRLTCARLGPWEVDLICRLDNEVLKAMAERQAAGEGAPTNTIALGDAEGMAAFMTRLTIQHNARIEAQKRGG
jgi:hypothetical protein